MSTDAKINPTRFRAVDTIDLDGRSYPVAEVVKVVANRTFPEAVVGRGPVPHLSPPVRAWPGPSLPLRTAATAPRTVRAEPLGQLRDWPGL